MEEGRSLKERLNELEDEVVRQKRQKEFKLPWKAKVGKKKIEKGWISVAVIHDNKNIEFQKTQIIDGTIKLKSLGGDVTYHSLDEKDIFFYKNKPFIFQPKRLINPYNPLKNEHETYGQKYLMARMEGDKLTLKKSLGMGVGVIIVIAIIGFIAYSFLK